LKFEAISFEAQIARLKLEVKPFKFKDTSSEPEAASFEVKSTNELVFEVREVANLGLCFANVMESKQPRFKLEVEPKTLEAMAGDLEPFHKKPWEPFLGVATKESQARKRASLKLE